MVKSTTKCVQISMTFNTVIGNVKYLKYQLALNNQSQNCTLAQLTRQFQITCSKVMIFFSFCFWKKTKLTQACIKMAIPFAWYASMWFGYAISIWLVSVYRFIYVMFSFCLYIFSSVCRLTNRLTCCLLNLWCVCVYFVMSLALYFGCSQKIASSQHQTGLI